MRGLVLDTGALIAVDRGDRRVGAMLKVAWELGLPVSTSAAVVAQVWRGGARQARLARVLHGVVSASLDPAVARRIGPLLAASGTADVVDAHVALLAGAGDAVLTSDPRELDVLLRARSVVAEIVEV